MLTQIRPRRTLNRRQELFSRRADGLPYQVEQPAWPTTGDVFFEGDVQLVHLGDNHYCLNHALRQEQIYGNVALKRAFDAICRGQTDGDANLMRTLFRHGFVVENAKTVAKMKERLIQHEDQKLVAPKRSFRLLRILLTDICNLACAYCKVVQNVDSAIQTPTDPQRLEEVIRFFFEHSEERAPKIVHITGGEPTIYRNRIADIARLTQRYRRHQENVWIVLGTNATLVTDADARFFADNDIKCIVSMDGPQSIHDTLRQNHSGHGSWKKVDEGLSRLKAAGVEVSISIVVGTHNIQHLRAIIEELIDRYAPTGFGVNFMKAPTPSAQDFEYLVTPKRYAEQLYDIHRSFRDYGVFLELVYRRVEPFVDQTYRFHDCGAAQGANLNVDAKGNIGPCKSFLVMNRLALSDLDAAAYQNAVIAKWRRRSPIYYDSCNGCPARGMCGNGCAYEAFIASGDDMNIDVRSCEYTQHFNQLFIADLYQSIKTKLETQDWHLVSQTERKVIAGKVSAIENSLSYSIGHPKFADPIQ